MKEGEKHWKLSFKYIVLTTGNEKQIEIINELIYKEYRKKDKHSDYLYSHMLQEAPKELSYKGTSYDIVFTKYVIRGEKEYPLKLSISKKMQEKYQVESINLLIPKKLVKLVDLESIKMIRIRKVNENIEMIIIYEREERQAVIQKMKKI